MIRSLLIVKESNASADGIMSRSLVSLFVILRRSFDCALWLGRKIRGNPSSVFQGAVQMPLSRLIYSSAYQMNAR